MKTTLELPDELMRRVKIRAASSDRKLKDTVADLIQRGLESAEAEATSGPIASLKKRLIFHPDGSVTNPDGIDDAAFFESLDEVRAESQRQELRDPFA